MKTRVDLHHYPNDTLDQNDKIYYHRLAKPNPENEVRYSKQVGNARNPLDGRHVHSVKQEEELAKMFAE